MVAMPGSSKVRVSIYAIVSLLSLSSIWQATAVRKGLPHQMPMPPTSTEHRILDPACVEKYQNDLVLPPIMPKVKKGGGDYKEKDTDDKTFGKDKEKPKKEKCKGHKDKNEDCLSTKPDEYEISVRQIQQHVLPSTSSICQSNYPRDAQTTVFAYGTDAGGKATHNWPGFTIEAMRHVPIKVTWVNELYDDKKRYLRHLFANEIDQTLHWANPQGLGPEGIDASPCHKCHMNGACDNDQACVSATNSTYDGPVPMVVHVHGKEDPFDHADGFAEAWFMPGFKELKGPAGQTYAREGTWYETFKRRSEERFPGDKWKPGSAVFHYRNAQRATQLWYHDHVLGITRLNVYAGMAGLYHIRERPVEEGPELPGLPYPPPGLGDNKKVREIPLAIQDRIFDAAGQLVYPVNNIERNLVLPNGELAPKWIPEFTGTLNGQPVGEGGVSAAMMVVNGKTWPKQGVVREPYWLRLLNGCNARSLIVYFSTSVPTDPTVPLPANKRIPFYVIGNEAGFFPSVVFKTEVLLGPAERYDIIFDFSMVPAGASAVYMLNEGPEVPYDGTNNAVGLTLHTAQIMRFDVASEGGSGATVSQEYLDNLNRALRAQAVEAKLPEPAVTRKLTLIEQNDASGNNVRVLFLGQANGNTAVPKMWADLVTVNPASASVEEWQVINLTPDAHPIHIHALYFQVVKRTLISVDDTVSPPTWTELNSPLDPMSVTKEAVLSTPCAAGNDCPVYKDTVLMAPASITTIRLKTGNCIGYFQWHCHLLSHEDNEMMRPFCIGQPSYQHPKTGAQVCPGPPGPQPL